MPKTHVPNPDLYDHFDELQDLTGEFDPGSERTLAARLRHASRARKGFGPSKAAHG